MRILIAIPDPEQRGHLVALGEALGCRVFEATSPAAALAGARACPPEVMLLWGAEQTPQSLAALAELCPSAALLLLLDEDDKLAALKHLQRGVADLLSPFPTRRELELALARVTQRRALVQQRDQLEGDLKRLRGTSLVGESRSMLRIHDQIQRIASTPRTTALVTGEPGTGKELVARHIHRNSARGQRPFVCVPCGAQDAERIETLLYGRDGEADIPSTDGALNGAEGGTLFLADIDGLGPALQQQVLELLQDRTWRCGPDGEERHVDVRVIASTTEDLARLVAEGRFREDLLYRLNVLSIELPPLRERLDDVSLLAEYFIEQVGHEMGKSGRTLAPEAMLALASHDWPGNVRQLRNALERGLITATGQVITRSDLGLGGEEGIELVPLDGAGGGFRIRHMEEVLIRRALQSAKGNRSKTARLLGVNRTTLYNKLRAYDIRD